MAARKVHYSSTAYALTICTILLSAAFLAPIPFAVADEHNDREKLKELKEKVSELVASKKNNDECPEKFKYGELCDKKKPSVDIVSPEKRDVVSGPSVTISATASDDLSGIKNVQVKIDGGSYSDATLNAGVWEFTTNLDPGRHFVFVKAIDNANNVKRDFTFFNVI